MHKQKIEGNHKRDDIDRDQTHNIILESWFVVLRFQICFPLAHERAAF